MQNKSRDWLIVIGLVLLSLAPFIGGAIRVLKIEGVDSSVENLRFLNNPIPIVTHILSASFYSLFGAFQFAPGFRSRLPKWHRRTGGVLVVLGIVVASTGIWMTLVYPVANHDTFAVYITRLLVGLLMLLFIFLSLGAIRQRKYIEHGHWMIRSYALAMGAGTQAFTHLPLLIFPSIEEELSRSISMLLGWIINLAFAEWIIFRSKGARAVLSPLLPQVDRLN